MYETPKRKATAIAVNDDDRDRADRLIEAGYASSFSEAVRVALAYAANSLPLSSLSKYASG